MAQSGILEENGEGQTRGNGSTESWLIQVKRTFDLQSNRPQLSQKVCIYRVIQPMVVCKPEAYEPTVVSLGPYHHKVNPKVSAMDEHKLEALHRTLPKLNGLTIAQLILQIQNLESDIRNCYEEAIEWNGETLSWMLAMDACFILEYFKCAVKERKEGDTDCLTSVVFQNMGCRNQTSYVIREDIFKLENQVPLFILIKILELEFGNYENAVGNLAEILSEVPVFTGYPFSSVWTEAEVQSKVNEHIKKGAYHLLDLRRRLIKDLLTTSSAQSVPKYSPYHERSTPTAELLHRAGIKFKSGEFQFRKQRFGSSTLVLPQIAVDDFTDTALRNLMAFEECQRCSWKPEDPVISEYICIMDDLIDTDKDVSLLTKEGIITSYLGSYTEVANLFNGICKGITVPEIEQFQVVIKQTKEHYYSQLKVWVSEFRKEYFSKPWHVVSLLVGMAILGMTTAQTVHSLKSN